MGDVSSCLPGEVFIAAEGGWTWSQWNDVYVEIAEVGGIYSTKDFDRGSARVSMGFKKGVSDSLAALGEIGYGYYGRTKFNFHQDGPVFSTPEAPDFSQMNIRATLDGFDVLAGFSYRTSLLDLSFKAGAMIENTRYKSHVNLSGVAAGGMYGSVFLAANLTQVFPEIKLEAAYQVANNLSLTASWMHVFGEKPSVNFELNPSSPPDATATVSTQNPRIDAVMLGVRYAFPVC